MAKKNKTVRVSVNQLAQYLVSNARRQRTIVQDAKSKPTYKVKWYDRAREAITAFAKTQFEDERPLESALDALHATEPDSDHQELVLRNDIEALESFLDSYHLITLDSLTIDAAPQSSGKLKFSGVQVSVRPELVLSGRHWGKDVAGAVKLHFGKTRPLTVDSASYVGALVHRATSEFADAEVSRKHCQVFDVLAGTVYEAPRSVTNRLRDIDAACEQIRLLWDVVDG